MRIDRAIAMAAALVTVSGLTAAVATAAGGDGAPARPAAVRPAAVVAPPPPDPAASHRTPASHPPAAEEARRALPYPLPAPPVQPQPCPPPPVSGTGKPKPLPPPAVADGALPVPAPAQDRSVDLAAVSGKGMWLTTWADTKLDVAEVVARARAAGLRQLWVRTGGTYQGYYGDRLLAALLPAAHRAGIAVIAWDFPTLSDPAADAQRARQALAFTVDGQRLDGFAPDIETAAERVYLSARRAQVYLALVRRYAGDRPVVATVPRPTDHNLGAYPYAALAPYVDAYAPMVYWSCKEPGALAAAGVARLARWRPVTVVGQSYDMGPEGGRHGLPSGAEIWRFLDATKRAGGIGASLYLYSQTKQPQWAALSAYPWDVRR